jgi:signal transduction histidine kinase
MNTVNARPDDSMEVDRDNYVAMVAHELRDPLMPILNTAAVLKRMPLDVDLYIAAPASSNARPGS